LVFFRPGKTFGSVNREALWFKTHKKVVSRGIVGWVGRMHEATEFCLRWNRDAVREPIPQEKGVRQGCSLRAYLFYIFIEDVVDCITEGNRHSPVAGELTIPYLLFAEDIAVGSFTTNGLPQGIKQIVKFCKYWGLKYNLTKSNGFQERERAKK
jgi:hypothetical protein